MRERQAHRLQSAAGLTLLEIMIVLGVVGLMTLALAAGYQRLASTALRHDAARIAGAMRSAFDRSSASGSYHRIMFDLDAQTFRLERCDGVVELRRSATVKEEADRRKDEEEKKSQEGALLAPDQAIQAQFSQGGETVGGAGGRAQASCAPVKGEMGKPQKLESHPKVIIEKLFVGHLDEPASEGQVTVNFFPMGYTERVVVQLASGEDDKLSIALHPMSGRVEIVNGAWRGAGDYMTHDAEGKAVNPQ